MANKEHLARLRKGASVWNEWRKKNPGAEPDLSEAELSGADLFHANLSRANLSEAHVGRVILVQAALIGADLRRADLREADLRGASLDGADLSEADLTKADLSWAYLCGANLSGVSLMGANLTRAMVEATRIRGARIAEATLVGLDISETEGLESVHHAGPSFVGVDTLYLSRGNIPEVFLRGCGVPENLITYLHSLTGKAFEFYSCFISYSTKNQQFAERLHADLQAKGVRCWFAPEDMKIGQKVRDALVGAIRLRDKLLLVLSRDSVESAWVEMEVETALEEERKKGTTVLFPIRLDDSVMEDKRGWATAVRQRHIGDFRNWKDPDEYQKAFQRLLCDLQAGDQAGKTHERARATDSLSES